MERLKNMRLKKAIFLLTFINVLIATFLSAIVFWGCIQLRTSLIPSGTQIVIGTDTVIKAEAPEAATEVIIAENTLTALQFGLPALFYVIALLLTASLFYRLKLKVPLDVLMDGTTHMMECDLDFIIPTVSGDEFGQLCNAFETMRQSLVDSNRELWQQAEERKRLNAAFSHDLRNPITVLKGSTKMAIQCADDGNMPQLMDNLYRIIVYTDRIDRYVETMNKAQHLEQLQPKMTLMSSADLNAEIEKALAFAVDESGKQLVFHGISPTGTLHLDTEMLFQIIENLVGNALRFAKQTVSVNISIEGDYLKLGVEDDGCGFSAGLLENGIRPFHNESKEANHFGMGLYICNLLCRKHGGHLKLANTADGACVVALLNIV